MKPAVLPHNEHQRLEALVGYRLLDTPKEPTFDRITELATCVCDTPIALISLIDHQRQWFKSKIGLCVTETPREYAFCSHTILTDELMEVPDSRLDERFSDNPLVSGEPHVIYYAGAPIVMPNNITLGTVCVIDHKPRKLAPAQLSQLTLLSQQVAELIQLRLDRMDLAALQVQTQRAFKSLPIGIHQWRLNENDDLIFEKANPAASEIMGVDNAIFEGMRMEEAFPALMHTDIPKRYKQIAREGGSFEREALNYEGQDVISAFSTLQLQSGPNTVVSFFQDVSSAYFLKRSLAESDHKLTLLTDNANDGFWHWPNPKNDALEWDDKMFCMLDYPPGEFIPSLDIFKTMLHKEDRRKTIQAMDDAIIARTPFEVEPRIANKHGAFRWFRLTGTPYFDGRGRFIEMAGSACDIHESMLNKTKLSRTHDELLGFAYRMSHDLKAPLVSSRRLSEFVMNDIHSGEIGRAKQNIANITGQMSKLENIVGDIHRLVQADLLEEQKQAVLIEPLIEQIKERLTDIKGYELCEFRTDIRVIHAIHIEREKLKHILSNLIINAVQYRDEKSHSSFVHLDMAIADDCLKIIVSDNGVGIGLDQRHKIFEPFARCHSQSKGAGLGLSIVKKNVDYLKGNIEMTSGEFGTSFVVTIPLQEQNIET